MNSTLPLSSNHHVTTRTKRECSPGSRRRRLGHRPQPGLWRRGASREPPCCSGSRRGRLGEPLSKRVHQGCIPVASDVRHVFRGAGKRTGAGEREKLDDDVGITLATRTHQGLIQPSYTSQREGLDPVRHGAWAGPVGVNSYSCPLTVGK